MFNKRIKVLLLTVLLLTPVCMYAQPGFDDDVDDVPTPLDGGASLLVAGAIAYGWKKKKAMDKEKEMKK